MATFIYTNWVHTIVPIVYSVSSYIVHPYFPAYSYTIKNLTEGKTLMKLVLANIFLTSIGQFAVWDLLWPSPGPQPRSGWQRRRKETMNEKG